MKSRKKVAVVGGGLAGIIMVKNLIEENIDCVCFEQTSGPGGTWNYRKEVQNGIASTMSTTTINNSKELQNISDYLWPEDNPNYMKHDELYKNILRFASDTGASEKIIYDKKVINVKRTDDYEETGRWIVTVQDTRTGDETSSVYDGVMLCTGHLAHPCIPQLPGLDEFEGEVIHTHSMRTFESFAGRKIAVVGFGCSALDAASETSRVANQVYLSARNQAWILPKISNGGTPFDFMILRRVAASLITATDFKFMSDVIQMLIINPKCNHRQYGIEASCPCLCREPVISEDITTKLACGAVVLRKGIKEIGRNYVLFEGETEPTQVDVIIMATGYKEDFSFLEDNVLIKESSKYHLYKLMYSPHLTHPTLAFIGFLLSWGPGFPLADLQARWAARLLNGKSTLPSKKVMMLDIDQRYKYTLERYAFGEKTHIRVDFMDYGDEIAIELGVKPNFLRMAFCDPLLFFYCMIGPYSSYQYRLYGPHKWEGARSTILTAHERILKGYPTKGHLKRKYRKKSTLIMFVIALVTLFLFVRYVSLPVRYSTVFITVILCVLGVNIIKHGTNTLLYLLFLFLYFVIWILSICIQLL